MKTARIQIYGKSDKYALWHCSEINVIFAHVKEKHKTT